MIRRLNNKGYMLIEIILAFVIAMGITYFMFELIIKIKNKNDDLLVKTLVSTDQAIIYNTIMKDIIENGSSFSCDKIKFDDNKFEYNGSLVSVVSKYAKVTGIDCKNDDGDIGINIFINVTQLSDNFNVIIKYTLDDDGSNIPNPSPTSNPSSSSSVGTS